MKALLTLILLWLGLTMSASARSPHWCKLKIYGSSWTIPLRLDHIKNDSLYTTGMEYIETDEGYIRKKHIYVFAIAEIQFICPVMTEPMPFITGNWWHQQLSNRKLVSGSLYQFVPWTKKYEIKGSEEKLRAWLK